MYLAIIVLPLLGSIVSGFFGRKVGVTGAQFLTSLSVIITTILAITVYFEVAFNNISVELSVFRWLDVELLNVSWGFNFDSLTVSMLIPVLIISSLVHVYSIGYMSHDPHNQRFFSYLSLFTFMMVVLVTANNFLLMFVGWEGVGVCSYLLVNFWFTRIAANQSSISAFLTNRVGDCFLTIGMFIILLTFGNLDYATVFSLAPFVSESSITIIGICLLIGAMAKSSQIGLHVWLPLAMEGPTPVSALIHAATMVTAGVYLLMRASPLIEYSSTVLVICLWIGSITTVFSSLIGLFQQDIKKVIAYSTMSQLGMMVIAIGLSSYNVALFHLVNHAFYKGLLFLGAGAVIHAIADNQDFRKYGGFIVLLPLSYTVMLIASLSLVAFPFMTGFYSKDLILESSFAQYNYSGTAVYYTALIGAVFTTLYSVKVLYVTFIKGADAPAINYNKAHEGNIYMSTPLVILALFSILFGFFTKDAFIGLASGLFIDNSLFIHPLHETTINSEFAVPHTVKLLPFILTIFISITTLIGFEFFPHLFLYLKFTRLGYNTFGLLNLRFLIEFVYNKYVAYFILKIGGHTTKVLDKGSIEKIGPYGLERILIILSKNLDTLSTGVVTTYALYILMGFILYITLPYILIDSHILLLVMYSALLFVINTDSVVTVTDLLKNNYKPNSYITVKSDFMSYLEPGLIILLVTGTATAAVYTTSHIITKYIKPVTDDIVVTLKEKAGINKTHVNETIDELHDLNGVNTVHLAENNENIYNIDYLAENLYNNIDSFFVNYIPDTLNSWVDSVIFAVNNPTITNVTCMACVLLSPVALYYLYNTCYSWYDTWYQLYYTNVDNEIIWEYPGINVPYINTTFFWYHYDRTVLPFLPPNGLSPQQMFGFGSRPYPYDTTVSIRHTFALWKDTYPMENYLIFDTMRIDRLQWGNWRHGFDTTTIRWHSDLQVWLFEKLGNIGYDPNNHDYFIEFINNVSGRF